MLAYQWSSRDELGLVLRGLRHIVDEDESICPDPAVDEVAGIF